MSPRRFAGCVVAVLLPAAACAPATPEFGRTAALLSPAPPPLGRDCRISPVPEVLPAADEILDLAALRPALARLTPARDLAPGYAVVSLSYDAQGWSARRVFVEHDLPHEMADSLDALLHAHGRTLPAGDPWGVRVRIDLGDPPRFRVGRQEVCEARPVEDAALLGVVNPWSVRLAHAPTPATRTAWVRVLVDETGHVLDAELEPGWIPPRAEVFLAHLVHSLAFDPALVDGSPVPGWVRLPVPLRPY